MLAHRLTVDIVIDAELTTESLVFVVGCMYVAISCICLCVLSSDDNVVPFCYNRLSFVAISVTSGQNYSHL